MQPFIIVRISDGASLPWCLSPLLLRDAEVVGSNPVASTS